MIDDVTGGQDEPKRPVVPRRRGLGKGLGAILPAPHPSPGEGDDERSRRDQLTGLPNRTELDERFAEAMARCRQDGASLAVLVVALDGFSEVNELYGHNVGDDLLHDAAARLSAARRKSDTVARFAGDEFVVVCPYVASAELACQMAARILEDLSRPTTIDKVETQLSASIGVVVTSAGDGAGDSPTLETLLGDASLAMRRAKDDGGASWKLFDPSMREHVVVRSQNRQDLRTALDEDGLVLEYEDIVDLGTGMAIGESAILGWSQPGPDSDQPQAPLDLVDEAGLAVPIGRWVLDQALSDLGARHAGSSLPAHFRVWVKVAPTLVADPTLVDIVDELTAKHGVSPSVLGLDVREPSAAALAATESNLRALYERDVVVGLDDFGAGQSNLALLQRLPISGLKLAPDLVAALGDDTGATTASAATGDVPTTPAVPDLTSRPHPSAVPEPDADGGSRADDQDAPDPLVEDLGDTDSGTRGDTDGRDDAEARAITLSREAAALVRGLIQLGQALELTVVAQGVESEAQVVALRALGCGYAQGPFLVGREFQVGREFLVGRETVPDEISDEASDDAPDDEPDAVSHDEPDAGSHGAPPPPPAWSEVTEDEAEIEDESDGEAEVAPESASDLAPDDSSQGAPDEGRSATPVTESLWAPGTLAT